MTEPVITSSEITTEQFRASSHVARQRLSVLIDAADSWGAALETVAGELRQSCGACASALVKISHDKNSAPVIEGLTVPLDSLDEPVRQQLILHAIHAVQSTVVQVRPMAGASSFRVGSALVRTTDEHSEVVVLLVDDAKLQADRIAEHLELAVACLQIRTAKQSTAEIGARLESAAVLIDLLARIESCDSLDDAAAELTNSVSRHFGNVSVVLCDHAGGEPRVLASSGLESELTAETEQAVISAVNESILRETLTVYPALQNTQRNALLAQKRLADLFDCQTVISSPLRDEAGEIQAGWSFLIDDPIQQEGSPQRANLLNFIAAANGPLGSVIKLLRRAEPTKLQTVLRAIEAPSNHWKRRVAIWGAVLTFVALMIPLPYNVKCNVQLEPVARRYVSVPFDSPLKQSLVEPGDLVSKNQVIAELDGHDIRFQLEEIRAEKQRAAQERDGHRARHDFGAAQISEYDMRKFQAREKMFERQIQELHVRSPIDGLVIVGDWKKSEGSPLEQGQSLFEIAPLKAMLVEVAIPEDDIAWVEVGQDIKVTLDANSDVSIIGHIETIHPRAEIRDQENVFIAEMTIPNGSDNLRPGMQGRGKISTVTRPLGWNLLHKPWNKFVTWLRYLI